MSKTKHGEVTCPAQNAQLQNGPQLLTGQRKRNLPADERRRLLLDAATEPVFGEGPAESRCRRSPTGSKVTQPLVHRYFATKSDLITAICDRLQNAHGIPSALQILTDRNRPTRERLADFYKEYLPHIYSDTWYRGFWYAALNDPTFAQAFIARVTRELHTSIIDEVRFRFGYPSVDRIPPFEREFELVWGMHSTMIFAGIRRYVYHTPVSDDVDTTVRDQMHAFLMVVADGPRRAHACGGGAQGEGADKVDRLGRVDGSLQRHRELRVTAQN